VTPGDALTAADAATLWRHNRARLAADHRAGRTRATGRPAHLKIELTNYCNLACPMCPHPQMRRAVGYMDPSLFRSIVDQAAPELEFAYLHHLGESLFHARVGELVEHGRSRGAAMGLSTNANFLDERKGRALLESGLDFLVVSLDAASPEAYARLRVGGDFQRTVENVRAFLALKRSMRARTDVAVQLILLPGNADELRPFTDEWARAGASVMIKEARDWAGQVPLERLGVKAREVGTRQPCKMPWTELTVMWDGAVVPCANHFEREHTVGDLRTQSLDEVWNGEALRRLRAAHRDDAVADVPVCATCPRHALDHDDFVAVDQLAQRRRTYLAGDGRLRPGLS
jgi:radical SAM protein with 4Fe4S-binding SPASM domain